MCGITAVFSRRSDVASDTLSAGTAALNHRGPDGRQHWISPDGRVGLGHARLSIIDLSTGDQPIANEDGSLVIVHNGEFYDFERIRAGLEARGHRFRTKSDSEVALHLYEELGPECVHQLRGEFAFIIWDSRNQRLFAARDRFGVKPLFYAEQDGALYFDSEAKALFAMGVDAAWSYESLFAGAFLIPAERTLFKGVYNVPPGHFMRATPEGFRLQQYWDVNYPRDDAAPAPRTDREYIEGFRAVLEESVKTRLRADVPVGCYLSGGIDSCAILGLASLHHVGPVRAYTLTFEAGAYDESVMAEEMAKRAGAEYRPVTAHQHDLADNFRAAVIQAELPCKNAHTVAKYMLSRAVRADGRKVVLTGEGSDELLAGYPHFRRDMLLHHTQGQSPEDVQRLMTELVANNQVSRGMLMPEGDSAVRDSAVRDSAVRDSAVRDSAVRDSAVRDSARAVLEFVPSWLETQAIDSKSTQSIMSDEFVASQGDTDTVGTFLASIDVKRCLEGRNAVHSALYLWAKSALPHYVLSNLGDRMEMGHSVEGRVPFMDHHVAEYLQNVPVNLKIRRMTEKYILREAVKDVITDTVYKRQKHPFLSPPSTHHRDAPLHQLMQDTLRSSAARDVPFLDQGKLIAMLDGIDHTNPGLAAVTDINLTVAMSYVFMHEGLRLGS